MALLQSLPGAWWFISPGFDACFVKEIAHKMYVTILQEGINRLCIDYSSGLLHVHYALFVTCTTCTLCCKLCTCSEKFDTVVEISRPCFEIGLTLGLLVGFFIIICVIACFIR